MRTVRYTDYDGDFEEAAPRCARLEEVLRAVDWAVSRFHPDADGHDRIYFDGPSGLYILRTDEVNDTAPLAVYFRVEDDDYATVERFEIDEDGIGEFDEDGYFNGE